MNPHQPSGGGSSVMISGQTETRQPDPEPDAFDASLLAEAMIPAGGNDPLWNDAARALLTAILLLKQEGQL